MFQRSSEVLCRMAEASNLPQRWNRNPKIYHLSCSLHGLDLQFWGFILPGIYSNLSPLHLKKLWFMQEILQNAPKKGPAIWFENQGDVLACWHYPGGKPSRMWQFGKGGWWHRLIESQTGFGWKWPEEEVIIWIWRNDYNRLLLSNVDSFQPWEVHCPNLKEVFLKFMDMAGHTNSWLVYLSCSPKFDQSKVASSDPKLPCGREIILRWPCLTWGSTCFSLFQCIPWNCWEMAIQC